MKCKICNSTKLIEVLDLGKQPLANKYPKNRKEIKEEKKFQLKIVFCTKCKLGKIGRIVSRDLMFKNYFYLSSVNNALVKHFESLAKKLKNKNFVIDIGSNDGILLKPLKKKRVRCLGIDPSINVGRIANKRGYETLINFFDHNTVTKVIKKYGKPDTIVASSVVTHLKDPLSFAKNIRKLISTNGELIIEIEYFANFIKNLEYERFYFDRPFYFSLKSIDILFSSVGMSFYKIEKINIHGGSVRCYIRNNKYQKKTEKLVNFLNNEKTYLNLHELKKFNLKIRKESDKLFNTLKSFKLSNKRVIGYGAPARVSTITNYTNIDNTLIDYIIDDSHLKQNRFSPGKHIKIIPRNKANLKIVDIVIVFAYEYFRDIRKKFANIKVKFYKPIPFDNLK